MSVTPRPKRVKRYAIVKQVVACRGGWSLVTSLAYYGRILEPLRSGTEGVGPERPGPGGLG